MCGIVGYIGRNPAQSILLEGLERLSYRGYDSAGIAVMDAQNRLIVRKAKGRLENLSNLLAQNPVSGCVGIGHTRWATHGEPSDRNAHPHTDVMGGIAVVHNGIIENHHSLRHYLESLGNVFVSETDTEVIAHLLHHLYDGDMRTALQKAMSMLQGSYALGVICDQEPNRLFCARNDSPLVIGFCGGEGFIASDIPAILSHTRDVIFMEDREIGVIDEEDVKVFDVYGRECTPSVFHVSWNLSSAEKNGYAHYMLKEIHEQPEALQKTLTGRNDPDDLSWLPLTCDEAEKLSGITIIGCGTACHAGMLARYAMEKLTRLSVDVEIASEYRYRDPVVVENELVIAISQSGETADTLAAFREAKRRGAKLMAVCNAVGSTLSREAGESRTLYTYAGPEIAVASTKAYLTQAEILLLLSASMAKLRKSAPEGEILSIYEALKTLHHEAEETLLCETQIRRLSSRLCQKKHVFFVGRGMDYALSMEAALKLKEVSYIFSEAYAAGELKHGPIALLQEGRVVVASITQKELVDKTLSNLQEAAARGAYLIVVCIRSACEKARIIADEVIEIPDAHGMTAPLLAAIPLQLFAYCMAAERGCDVDKPRNLAKSVTVE